MMKSEVYNQFSISLVEHIVERALGCDPASERILNARPADHVLAGFLTPIKPKNSDHFAMLDENGEDEDLPQDSPYEQSAIGMEWLIPLQALRKHHLKVAIDFSVYVRRLPAYEEQKQHLSWNKARGEATAQTSPLIAVWTREDLPRFEVEVDLAALQQKGVLTLPLRAKMALAWAEYARTIADLFPASSSLSIPQADINADRYAAWVAAQKPKAAQIASYNWAPRIDARLVSVPTVPECMRLSLRFINGTPWRNMQQSEYFDPNLYAVRLLVAVPKDAHHAMEFADLPRSYRYDRTIPAVGINADVQVQEEAPETYLFSTQSIARKRVDRLEPREIESAAPTFKALRADPVPLLRHILEAMRTYDGQAWQRKVDTLPTSQRAEAIRDREIFRSDEIVAFERGISLLENPEYPLVRQAFCLMNETMERVAVDIFDRWRLFQIVFIVVQLPRLAVRQYPELEQQGDDSVDILWFAAGGGKTEAFLGLLVWHMFFDRLRGKQIGVTALVRFPLRLLTFQQLQRMARVLAQAELIRKREHLGGARFSLGYFVGGNTRPNAIDDDRDARYSANGPDESLRSLMRCPFCKSKVILKYDKKLRLVEHYCESHTTCPGGSGRLPIYIIDRDIYRYLPTVIVSTVDKLALIGQNPRFGNLFGRFDLYCTSHGASFLDTNSEFKCTAAAYTQRVNDERIPPQSCEGRGVLYGPFVDPAPALLIQDELHLLSEETGVFDSHYETAAIQIMRSLGHRPWKIIAATATIERFDHHARHLYLKEARQFPCPGPGAYDSFYYQVNPHKIGRIFVGLLGVGRKHTPAVTRLLSLIYQELQTARDEATRDLAAACGRYHMPLLTRQEFDLLIFYYELVLTYVLTRKGSDQVAEAIQSRVKKELRELMPTHGELLIETLNGSVDVTEMIETMEMIEMAQAEGKPAERVRGVVATNIISHGVDINRFNIIVFGGFTRLVAEYIQASARVGRTFPGISFFVVTPQSERDRSIFQRFGKFHEYLDRLIDPSAINRWPTPVLDRTVPGVLAGYLMIVAAARLGKRLETVRKLQQTMGEMKAECLNEANIIEWMKLAYGTDRSPYARYTRELSRIVSNRYAQIINAAPEQSQGWDGIRNILNPMQSLRDIDDPAYIQVIGQQDVAILRNMLRP